jgi:hypothetical protein
MGETASYLMAGAYTGQAIGSILQAKAQSAGIEAQGEYHKSVSEMNSRLATLSAEDALRRGKKAAYLHKREIKRTIGSQRAALAAQGIEIDDGSALEVQMDTATQGELDAITIKNNAFREAWGYKMEAVAATARGEFAAAGARFDSRMTMLTGGMNALNYGIKAGERLVSTMAKS